MQTAFNDDEFVIYNLAQQKMQYLFEYSLPQDTPSPCTTTKFLPNTRELQQFINSTNTPCSLDINTEPPPTIRPSGLVVTSLSTYIDQPCNLNQVRVTGKVLDFVGEFTVFQEFTSTNKDVAQAKYIFPLDEMAAVCAFEAFVNGKHIIGYVKEKNEAKQIYQEAVDKGFGAYLMTQESDDRDLFCLSIGNILPASRVIIKISYVTELRMDPVTQNLLLSFPQSIRQTSLGTENTVHRSTSFLLQISITMPYDIQKITCNVNQFQLKQTRTKATLQLTDAGTFLQDICISIEIENADQPRLYIEENDDAKGSYAAMLSICPSFQWTPPAAAEILFIIDRSASMKDHWKLLQSTVNILFTQLEAFSASPNAKETSVRFNIIGFGATFEWLFVEPQKITPESLATVRKFVESELRADLGGSDAWLPLSAAYLLGPQMHGDSSRVQRSIFLITDGAVTELDVTRNLILENVEHTRVFTIGIGPDVSKAALKSLSQLGGGTSVCILDDRAAYNTAKQLQHQLQQTLQPSWQEIQVHWGLPGQQKTGNSGFQSPSRIHSLFQGERLLVYYLGDELYTSANITAKAMENHQKDSLSSGNRYSASVDASPWWKSLWQEVNHVVSTYEMAVTRGKMLHRLAARSLLREWEDGGNYADHELSQLIQETNFKSQILHLSIHYQLVTKFTAFVAVEERFTDEDMNDIIHSSNLDDIWISEVCDELVDIPWDTVSFRVEPDVSENIPEESSEAEDLWDLLFLDDEGEEYDDSRQSVGSVVETIDGIQGALPSGMVVPANAGAASKQSISNMQSAAKETYRQRSKHLLRLLDTKIERVAPVIGSNMPKNKTCSRIMNVQSTSRSYRSGGAVKSSEKQNETEREFLCAGTINSSEENDFYLTPFGFYAAPVASVHEKIQKQLKGSCITHLFQGPLNSGGDCWLNAVLMLCFSMGPFRNFIHKFTKSFSKISAQSQLRLLQKPQENSSNIVPSLILSLEAISANWKLFCGNEKNKLTKSKAQRYREGLLIAQKRILTIFSEFGFVSKDPQCAIKVFQTIEDQMSIAFQENRLRQQLKKGKSCEKISRKSWFMMLVSSWDFCSNHWRLMKKKTESRDEEFIILCNREYSALPFEFIMRNSNTTKRLMMNGYILHAFLSFECMQDGINHFRTFVIDYDRFILYNDILHIGTHAGGYQGGVFDLSSCKNENHPAVKILQDACKMVPICIFRRVANKR